MAFQIVVRMIFVAVAAVGFVVSYLKARSAVKFIQAKDYKEAKKEALLSFVGMCSSWFLIWVSILG